jgi:hypothetical protein
MSVFRAGVGHGTTAHQVTAHEHAYDVYVRNFYKSSPLIFCFRSGNTISIFPIMMVAMMVSND